MDDRNDSEFPELKPDADQEARKPLMNRVAMPHTLVLLSGILILAYLATWVLPAGRYQMHENRPGKFVVVPGTFELTPEQPRVPIWSVSSVK